MTVPSRGEDAPSPGGRALPRSQGARLGPVARPHPGGPGAPGAAEKAGAARWPDRPSTCRGRRAPRRSRPHPPPSPPALFVTARLPVCGLQTPAHFPGREAAEGREFLGDAPARRAPPPASTNPAPGLGARSGPEPRPREAGVASGPAGGTAQAPLPGTRGRCAAVGGRRLPRGLASQPFSVPGPERTSRGRGRRAGVRCWS